MRRYTKEEHEFMKDFVPGHSYKEIREAFLERFGGEVPESFPKGFIANNKLNTGRTGHFTKGHVSANKGKKMSPERYEKCKATMFKPGTTTNIDPIGTEKVLSDGYVWIKVDDKPKAKKQENWIRKHRMIYEELHGPIPEGHYIIFLDGDRMNFDPDNLAAVSKAEHVRMNQLKLRFSDAELTRTGLGIARIASTRGKRRRGK